MGLRGILVFEGDGMKGWMIFLRECLEGSEVQV